MSQPSTINQKPIAVVDGSDMPALIACTASKVVIQWIQIDESSANSRQDVAAAICDGHAIILNGAREQQREDCSFLVKTVFQNMGTYNNLVPLSQAQELIPAVFVAGQQRHMRDTMVAQLDEIKSTIQQFTGVGRSVSVHFLLICDGQDRGSKATPADVKARVMALRSACPGFDISVICISDLLKTGDTANLS